MVHGITYVSFPSFVWSGWREQAIQESQRWSGQEDRQSSAGKNRPLPMLLWSACLFSPHIFVICMSIFSPYSCDLHVYFHRVQGCFFTSCCGGVVLIFILRRSDSYEESNSSAGCSHFFFLSPNSEPCSGTQTVVFARSFFAVWLHRFYQLRAK